jgi:hypothetical protein
MSSPGKPELIDLDRGLPVSAEDVAALRRARSLTSLTWREYEAFLTAQPPASAEALRARPLLLGEPFRLRD